MKLDGAISDHAREDAVVLDSLLILYLTAMPKPNGVARHRNV